MTPPPSDSPHVAISVLCGPTGGPATYGKQLVAALAARDDIEVTVLTDRPDAFNQTAVRVIDVPMRGGLDRLRWQHVAIPRALRRLDGCALYHDTKNALPRRCPMPAVVTVHDLAYYRCPETFGWASRTFLRRATRHATRTARRILVPSAATRDDVVALYPDVSGSRVDVIPHGIAPAPTASAADLDRVRSKYDLGKRPFVLHVGTIQARKNVDRIVLAVRQLRAEGLSHEVLAVGRKGWLAEAAFREFETDDTGRWLGAVPTEDLPALYALADAFCAPSSYEGFGFTVADALAAGVPTVIADVSSLPEVCGDAAERARSLAVTDIANALRRVLADPARRQELAAAGPRRAAQFTWAKAAYGHVAAYRAALDLPA